LKNDAASLALGMLRILYSIYIYIKYLSAFLIKT